MERQQIFLRAIHEKCVVNVVINTAEKGIITRTCIPFDFGPSRKYRDGLDRYHFYDLDSPDGKHNLSVLTHQLIEISLSGQTFNPEDFVTWEPRWFTRRDWGAFS